MNKKYSNQNIEKRQKNVINISNICNQKCIFCSNYPKNKICIDKVKKLIDKAEKDVFFQGGEPTLQPELINLIKYSKKKDKTTTLVTNGMRLSYKNYTKAVFNAGLNQIFFAFHSPEEKLNDFLSNREGSFKSKCQALKNIISLKKGKDTRLVYVINIHNQNKIFDFVKFIAEKYNDIGSIEFKLIQTLGNPEQNEKLFPDIEEFIEGLNKAITEGKKTGIKIQTNGIPLCYLEDNFESSVEYFMKKNNQKNLTGRCFIEQCKKCKLKKDCMGYRQDYIKKDFIKIELSKELSELAKIIKKEYSINSPLIEVLKYKGHNCSGFKMMDFGKNIVIVKLSNNLNQPLFEDYVAEIYSNKIKTPRLLQTKDSKPYAKQDSKIIKVYEFIPSSRKNNNIKIEKKISAFSNYLTTAIENSNKIKIKSEELGISVKEMHPKLTEKNILRLKGISEKTSKILKNTHDSLEKNKNKIKTLIEKSKIVYSNSVTNYAYANNDIIFHDFEDICSIPIEYMIAKSAIILSYQNKKEGIIKTTEKLISSCNLKLETYEIIKFTQLFFLIDILENYDVLIENEVLNGMERKDMIIEMIEELCFFIFDSSLKSKNSYESLNTNNRKIDENDNEICTNKIDLHRKIFKIKKEKIFSQFQELIEGKGDLCCSLKIEGSNIFASRFIYCKPDNIKNNVKKSIEFFKNIEKSEKIKLDYKILNNFIKELDFRKAIYMCSGIDIRENKSETRLKLWIHLVDYPEKIKEILSIKESNKKMMSIKHNDDLLVGIDLSLDGKARLKTYIIYENKDLKDGKKMDKLKRTLNPKALHLMGKCKRTDITPNKDNKEMIFHFMPYSVEKFIKEIDNIKLKSVYKKYCSGLFIPTVISISESGIIEGKEGDINIYY